MLSFLEQGKANRILAWHYDKLARNSIDGGKIINSLGLVGKKDKALSVSNYQYLLRNPFYYALIRYNGEYYEGKHEPIITKKLFDECQ